MSEDFDIFKWRKGRRPKKLINLDGYSIIQFEPKRKRDNRKK